MEIFKKLDMLSLPVLKNKKFVGVVYKVDILDFLCNSKSKEKQSIEKIYKSETSFIEEKEHIEDASKNLLGY